MTESLALADDIATAWCKRQRLFATMADTDAYRVFHGWTEGFPGLEIDRYGFTAVVAYKGTESVSLETVKETLLGLHPFESIVFKRRGETPIALVGELSSTPVVVKEQGIRYVVEPWQRGNPGLYLDARPARRWLRKNSSQRHVLNLFAHAGALGVAARAGGATSVTHVDTQRRALERCRENHRCNEQQIGDRDLVRGDVLRYLRKAQKRRLGGIVLDPPPMRGILHNGIMDAVALATSMLAPDGWLLCLFHHDDASWDSLHREVRDHSTHPLELVWHECSDGDFPEPDERRTLRMSAFRRCP